MKIKEAVFRYKVLRNIPFELREWQCEWDNSTKRRYTHVFFQDVHNRGIVVIPHARGGTILIRTRGLQSKASQLRTCREWKLPVRISGNGPARHLWLRATRPGKGTTARKPEKGINNLAHNRKGIHFQKGIRPIREVRKRSTSENPHRGVRQGFSKPVETTLTATSTWQRFR